MKKTAAYLLLTILFFSCSQDARFNDVAFQALKNNNLWKATEFSAVIAANGALTLEGNLLEENLSINLNSASRGTYNFTPNSGPKATFISVIANEDYLFKTNKSNNYGIGDDIIDGSGSVTITINDGTKISGNFTLELVNDDIDSDIRKVDFIKGYFNNVPLTR